MTDVHEIFNPDFAWEFSIHETHAVHLHCCWHPDSTVLFYTDNTPVWQPTIQSLNGFRSTVNLISQEFHAEWLTFQQLALLPSTKLQFIESLSNKASEYNLLNAPLLFTHYGKNLVKYMHSIMSKVKVHAERV